MGSWAGVFLREYHSLAPPVKKRTTTETAASSGNAEMPDAMASRLNSSGHRCGDHRDDAGPVLTSHREDGGDQGDQAPDREDREDDDQDGREVIGADVLEAGLTLQLTLELVDDVVAGGSEHHGEHREADQAEGGEHDRDDRGRGDRAGALVGVASTEGRCRVALSVRRRRHGLSVGRRRSGLAVGVAGRLGAVRVVRRRVGGVTHGDTESRRRGVRRHHARDSGRSSSPTVTAAAQSGTSVARLPSISSADAAPAATEETSRADHPHRRPRNTATANPTAARHHTPTTPEPMNTACRTSLSVMPSFPNPGSWRRTSSKTRSGDTSTTSTVRLITHRANPHVTQVRMQAAVREPGRDGVGRPGVGLAWRRLAWRRLAWRRQPWKGRSGGAGDGPLGRPRRSLAVEPVLGRLQPQHGHRDDHERGGEAEHGHAADEHGQREHGQPHASAARASEHVVAQDRGRHRGGPCDHGQESQHRLGSVGAQPQVPAGRPLQEVRDRLLGLQAVQSRNPVERREHHHHRTGHDQPPGQRHLTGARQGFAVGRHAPIASPARRGPGDEVPATSSGSGPRRPRPRRRSPDRRPRPRRRSAAGPASRRSRSGSADAAAGRRTPGRSRSRPTTRARRR